ncbi:MAG: serine protease [Planctomycetota bacterium]
MKKTMMLVMAAILIMGCEIPEPQIAQIEIVKAPNKEPHNPYQEEYEQMLYPVVRIISSSGTGSGVIINVERGAKSVERIEILTAAHVVGDENIVNIEFYDSTVITATIVITDTAKDLAFLHSTLHAISAPKGRDLASGGRSTFYTAHLAPESYTPYLFTPVWAVGCSLGLKSRPSQGIISVIEADHWEMTAPILPGNSGGPVYDARTYEVIGIAVWVKVYQGQLVTTMAGVVPVNQVYEFLEKCSPAKAGSKGL